MTNINRKLPTKPSDFGKKMLHKTIENGPTVHVYQCVYGNSRQTLINDAMQQCSNAAMQFT